MDFGTTGLVVLGLFLATLMGVAELARRAKRDASPADHFLAGRSLGPFVLFLTLYATAYSGNSLLGYPGSAYRQGFAFVMSTGFMMSIIVVFHALVPRLRPLAMQHGFVTPGDYLRVRFEGPFSRALRLAIAVLMTLALANFLLAQLKAMGQVVESLLMLARAEGGLQVSMGDAPVNEFVMSAVERTARMAERNDVTIVPTLAMPEAGHDSLVVHGDQALLTIAVTNLLRNAIRYAPPRTQVSIAVEAIDQHAVIHVRDGGPGIPPEHLPHIFDRFYRVPDDHSTFQGTGLGLAIAKGVVDLHRGQIHAVNLPEGGCQFTLTLGTAHT